MKKITMVLLAALLCLPASSAMAGIGAGIGATFPVGGSGQASSADVLENYAAVAGGGLTVAAAVRETDGGLYLELRLVNPADTPFVVEHKDSQLYDFALFDEGGHEIWRWSTGRAFTQQLVTESIPPQGTVSYTANIDKKDYKKLKKKAELVRLYVTDTPYVLMLKIPQKQMAAARTPVTLHGSIEIGSGHDW